MTVQIKVRDEKGRFREAYAGEFVAAAIGQCIAEWGWWFFRLWLGRVCLQIAERESDHSMKADLWIRRYQAIRGIE